LNREDNVAVIGGGSTGSSAAYHLARAGHRVTLLEMDQVGSGMTSRSSANVRTHYSHEILVRMALYSLGQLRGMEGAGFVNSGMLYLISKEYESAARANVSMLKGAGVREDVLDRSQVASMFPEVSVDDVDYMLHEPESGYADPVSTARTFAAMAQSAGAQVWPQTRVEKLETSSQGPTTLLLGDGRRVEFSKVVLCTNIWTNRLLSSSGIGAGDLLPLRVVPHPIVVYRRPPSYEGVKVIVSDYLNKAYYKPEGRTLLFGGSIDAELDKADTTPEDCPREAPDEYVSSYSESLMRRIPVMQDGRIQNTYYGIYDSTPDELPIVDELSSKGLPGVYTCVGLSGHGFKMCPAFGVMVTEMLESTERPTFDRSSFRLSRFEGQHLDGTHYQGLSSVV
jgi:sarcosine oxidase, subunit beta